MDNFMVGGFLPGTNTQFSFQAWLIAMALIINIVLLIWLSYKRSLYSRLEDFIFVRTYAPSAAELHLSLSFKKLSSSNLVGTQLFVSAYSSLPARKARSLASNIYLRFQS